MRRQRFVWAFLALAIVLTAYGSFSFIQNLNQGKGVFVPGLTLLIIGGVMLLLCLVFYLLSRRGKTKEEAFVPEPEKEEKPVVREEEKKESEPKGRPSETPCPAEKMAPASFDSSYIRKPSISRYDRDDSENAYVKKIGYGPVLRVTGSEILDMRTNTYYRIEGSVVNQSGYGPMFEISGNRIRAAFGGYLFEISGDNVSKTFGGYFATFNGGFLQTNDLSERFEITGPLSLRQRLAVVALLFGTL